MVFRRWSAARFCLPGVLALLALPSPSLAATEPCKLLTPAEISGALGSTFGQGQPIGTTG